MSSPSVVMKTPRKRYAAAASVVANQRSISGHLCSASLSELLRPACFGKRVASRNMRATAEGKLSAHHHAALPSTLCAIPPSRLYPSQLQSGLPQDLRVVSPKAFTVGAQLYVLRSLGGCP